MIGSFLSTTPHGQSAQIFADRNILGVFERDPDHIGLDHFGAGFFGVATAFPRKNMIFSSFLISADVSAVKM